MVYILYTLPEPPFLGVWNGLRDCSATKGLSVIKSSSSSNSKVMKKFNGCIPQIRIEEQSLQQELPLVGANFSTEQVEQYIIDRWMRWASKHGNWA
jgi:hypothetical protein